jgi:3-oxoacyl-[acyl-carrier protein] reductase
MMELGIKGRKAIVAGGSAGMGKDSALALAREGVEIYLSARGEARLLASAQEIAAATGTRVVPVVADHGTSEGRARLLAACPDPDILVITCSPPRFLQSYLEPEPEEWMSALSTTLIGPVELMRATVGGMAERGFGRVVNIGTIAAKRPHESRLLSGPPRAALSNYAAAISSGLAKHNVAINTILPGMFRTDSMQSRFDAQAKQNGTTPEQEADKWIAQVGIPASKLGDTRDVGALCALLCSQYASFIIGQSIVIDGGQHFSTF